MTDHPRGYGMRDCDISKGDADCPSESVCQFDSMVGECHAKCGTQADCRSGYVCSPASSDATSTFLTHFATRPDRSLLAAASRQDLGGTAFVIGGKRSVPIANPVTVPVTLIGSPCRPSRSRGELCYFPS